MTPWLKQEKEFRKKKIINKKLDKSSELHYLCYSDIKKEELIHSI